MLKVREKTFGKYYIWSCTHAGPLNGIFKQQKTAIRIISHTEPLKKILQILPLPDLITTILYEKKTLACGQGAGQMG